LSAREPPLTVWVAGLEDELPARNARIAVAATAVVSPFDTNGVALSVLGLTDVLSTASPNPEVVVTSWKKIDASANPAWSTEAL
jgi:hypothetical protein